MKMLATMLAAYAGIALPSACEASGPDWSMRFPAVKDPIIAIGKVTSVRPRFYADRYGNREYIGEATLLVRRVIAGKAPDSLTFAVHNIEYVDYITGRRMFSYSTGSPSVPEGENIIAVFGDFVPPKGARSQDGLFTNLKGFHFIRWFKDPGENLDPRALVVHFDYLSPNEKGWIPEPDSLTLGGLERRLRDFYQDSKNQE